MAHITTAPAEGPLSLAALCKFTERDHKIAVVMKPAETGPFLTKRLVSIATSPGHQLHSWRGRAWRWWSGAGLGELDAAPLGWPDPARWLAKPFDDKA
jgi:hypothetical protein